MQDRRFLVRMISKVVGTVDTTLMEELKVLKICPKDPLEGPETVPCGMLHWHARHNSISSFLNNVVTCDESQVFTHNPESKCQSVYGSGSMGLPPIPRRQG